jgi:hypothetical protein
VIGCWGKRAAVLSLAVMVAALFLRRDAIALAAGAVFILAAAVAVVGHFFGES